MKKRVLVLIMVMAFTLFATSTAFAVVQEEPIELKEGEMGITSVEGEQVAPDQPVSTEPNELKRSNEQVDNPDATTSDEDVKTISAPATDATTEEDVRLIMAPDSSGVPEMAQTGVVEDTKKDNTKIYLATAVALLGVSGFILFQRRKRS